MTVNIASMAARCKLLFAKSTAVMRRVMTVLGMAIEKDSWEVGDQEAELEFRELFDTS